MRYPSCVQVLLGSTMNFCTPVRASRLNLSSVLADLTPNTNTWSRLKAALSIHRKGMGNFIVLQLFGSILNLYVN